jgi:hypothetical protein
MKLIKKKRIQNTDFTFKETNRFRWEGELVQIEKQAHTAACLEHMAKL